MNNQEAVERIQHLLQDESPSLICRDAAESHDPEDLPENAVLTHWILVAEWCGDDGQFWVTRTFPERQPRWRTNGLLHEGLSDA